ncbi:MAG: phosphate/phosphite/phosphonate ABC transporter substrate-binding protein [Firmicutes bacterium]|nr:phosphate/phosphite/phosphonate ABC transporter substrate-binding protein [Bacillota bacterium]
MRRTTLGAVILGIMAAVWLLGATAFAQGDEMPSRLVLGMVPSREADRMVRSLDPLAQMLSERLGRPVSATVATSPQALIEALRSQRVDVGIFGPFALILAEERAGAVVILNSIRRGADHYRAQFLVRADSGIESFDDLKGKVWAVPSLTSTSGYLFPYVALSEAGLEPTLDMTIINVVGHDAAVLAVYNGDADLATTYEDARTDVLEELPDVMEKVKVLAYTEPIPNDGVVVRRELHPDLVRQIQQALIDIGNTDEGQQLLDTLYNVTGFVEADSARYDVVRRTYQLLKDQIRI